MRAAGPEAALRALPPEALLLVEAVIESADRSGQAVYLVGGPVRDLLLGRAVRDVDLIVEEKGGEGAPELARRAAPEGARTLTHGRFGTVRLESGKTRIDLATVRSETYPHAGALPRVAPGTLRDDLERRDFTVNALAVPLSAPARGSGEAIVDPDDGRRDLSARRLRVFHKQSFHDDPTRALRAARLAVRLGFTLSRGSRSALRDALRDGAFGRVSGDRLRRELEKLFEDAREEGADPVAALRLLDGWHVLGALEPGLSLRREARAPLRRLGRALSAPPWPVRGRLRPWVPGLALWLAPLDAGLRSRTLRRLSVQGAVYQTVTGFPKARDRWLRRLERARGRGAVDEVIGELDEEVLHALFASAPAPLRRRIVRHEREDRPRRPPVTGRDLVAVGLSGPDVGRALARIRSAWLDGRVRSRDEALALARELVRPPAGGARGNPRGRRARPAGRRRGGPKGG